jgi:phage terminase Nu1 subunit (DNA packaging protein)
MAQKTAKSKHSAARTEVARHLDLSVQRVRELIRKEILPELGTIDEYRLAFMRHLRTVASKQASQDGKLDLTAERARLTRAQTEKTEIEVAHLKGEPLPRTLVTQVWQMHAAAVRSRFLGLTSKLRMRIPRPTQDESEVIDGIVCEILEELAGDGLPASARAAVDRYQRHVQTTA